MVDSMAGVAQDTLRSRAEGSEASAFGMHQADAGSDAYDRDFALSLLSQEQDALYEIDQALRRIELGTYGKCEMSGKQIPRARLEAIPSRVSPLNASRNWRSKIKRRASANQSPLCLA
jgi:DnaK suppressor protein